MVYSLVARIIECIPTIKDLLKQLREDFQELMLKQAVVEGFITDDTISLDATQFEVGDQALAKQKKMTVTKLLDRKLKHERDAWLKKEQMEEEQKSIYAKEIAAQLTETYFTLRNEITIDPQWEIKKSSEGENPF